MNAERIREKITNGFTPFSICMSDGRTFAVPNPEFIAIGKSVVVVIGKNDRVTTLDASHITSIEEKAQRG
jgi:hypothetical protein